MNIHGFMVTDCVAILPVMLAHYGSDDWNVVAYNYAVADTGVVLLVTIYINWLMDCMDAL